MNEYATKGKLLCPEMKIPLFINNGELSETNTPKHLKIIYIENGNGIFSINGNKMGIISPMLIILNNKDFFEIINGNDLIIKTLLFHPDVINSNFNLENIYDDSYNYDYTAIMDRHLLIYFFKKESIDKIVYLNASINNNVKSYINIIAYELETQKDIMWPCTARGYLIQLLFLIQRLIFSGNAIVLPENISEIEDVIVYLLTNYDNKITLNELVKEFNTNRTTLCMKFKEKTGVSIFSYLIKLRLDIAASLMHNTELTINEIIYRSGFNDPAYFGKIFKSKYKQSPSDYRKQYQKMLY